MYVKKLKTSKTSQLMAVIFSWDSEIVSNPRFVKENAISYYTITTIIQRSFVKGYFCPLLEPY